MSKGVSFYKGNEDTSQREYTTLSSEPSGTANEIKFADNGGGDVVNRAYGTTQNDKNQTEEKDMSGGKGVEFTGGM